MATSYKTAGQQAYEKGQELQEIMATAETMLSMLSPNDIEWVKAYRCLDSKTNDAVMAFRLTLEAVKQVFGEENLTTEVMTKAIEAGSFIGYRAIMGEAANTTVRRY